MPIRSLVKSQSFPGMVVCALGFGPPKASIKQNVVDDLQTARHEKWAPNSTGLPRKAPAIVGEIAVPIDRAIPVTPAAAERSSGATTGVVWDCRSRKFLATGHRSTMVVGTTGSDWLRLRQIREIDQKIGMPCLTRILRCVIHVTCGSHH